MVIYLFIFGLSCPDVIQGAELYNNTKINQVSMWVYTMEVMMKMAARNLK